MRGAPERPTAPPEAAAAPAAPQRFRADRAAQGLRFDRWLEQCLPQLSRSRLQRLIKDGHITLNGRAAKAHTPVRAGAEAAVALPPPAPPAVLPEPMPLDVLYEDEDVIVVNKPAGLVVHPAAGHAAGTLVNALLHRCGRLAGGGEQRRPGIVHRLDKDTSGALVAAKNDAAQAALTAQFKAGAVRKEYLALVWGVPRPPAGRIETLIGRSRADRKKMSARVRVGRRAVTHYELLESLGPCALLRVRIETGRTHQIRVHLAHIGHPVVGDRQYGRRRPPAAARQLLHAQRLTFAQPRSGRRIECAAPLPADFAEALARLRAGGALP